MALIVLKFGGTSLANIDRMKNAASIIAKEIKKGNSAVVIVSAMAGVTDDLVRLANSALQNACLKNPSEYDVMLATGEIVSSALVTMILASEGIKAESMQGWQLGMHTDEAHTEANIQSIDVIRVRNLLKNGVIPIICGFQGVNRNRVTTLGRGGSDTTAVAVAAALGADRCDIYTDVDGIYSADPNVAMKARRYTGMDYDTVIAMGYNGAKVMHPRSIEIAKSHSLKLRVLSSLNPQRKGTIIGDTKMEDSIVTAITSKKNLAITTLTPNDSLANVIAEVSKIAHDVEAVSSDEVRIVSDHNYEDVIKSLQSASVKSMESGVMQITLVGNHIRKNTTILQKVFQLIESHNIRLIASSVNDICLTFWVKNCGMDFIAVMHDELILNDARGSDEKVA